MEMDALQNRVDLLERRLRRQGWWSLAVLVMVASIAATTCATRGGGPAQEVVEEVRTRKLVVVDDQGRERVVIEQDGPEIERQSRSAGLTIFDDQGRERGGIATADDGSAVIALDAPWGVGSPMRDRAGMKVNADGSALMGLISNRGQFAAVLHSDGDSGRLELYRPAENGEGLEQRTISVSEDPDAMPPAPREAER